jgi:phosphoglycolate phosphatase-like HAD superfamily hydrolase
VTLKAVIFDYKTMFSQDVVTTQQVRDLLLHLAARDVQVCIFSTDPLDVSSAAQERGYPMPAAYVNRADVAGAKNRGSPLWIDAAQDRLGVERHELLYVGCTSLDWRTAINSAVFYRPSARPYHFN